MEKLLGTLDSLEMNELHRAVKNNRLEAVKELLKSNADIEYTINAGQTPLYIATKFNYHPIMEELIKNEQREKVKKLINLQTFDTGSAALHVAAENNSIESVRILLGFGANFEIEDNEKRRPVDLTTDESIKELLEMTKEIEIFSSLGDNEALLCKLKSCPSENLAAVMYACNSEGHTALQVAIQNGHLEAIGTIVNCRIENLKRHGKDIVKIDELTKSFKSVKREANDLEILCHKIRKSLVESCEGETNFRWKVWSFINEAFGFLEAARQKVGEANFTNQQLLGVISECLEIFGVERVNSIKQKSLMKLLEHGVTIAWKTLQMCIIVPMLHFMKSVYSSGLLRAAKQNKLTLVQKYLNGHPDVDEVDDNGWTAFHYALSHGNLQIANLLLNFGANPMGLIEKQKITPLLAALSTVQANSNSSRFSGAAFVKTHLNLITDSSRLIKYLDVKDSNGSTALHLAVKLKQQWLVELLLSKGAMYCVRDSDGKLPEDYAESNVRALFRYIDELFTHVYNKNTDEVINESLKSSRGNTLLAVCGARNEQEFTLVQILNYEGVYDVANRIVELLADTEWCDK